MLKLPKFNAISAKEALYAQRAIAAYPLSGFLGGVSGSGPWVEKLENFFKDKLGVTHAIACNSATSGLLAACRAVGVARQEVITTPFTMSATAAAPAFLGAHVKFLDIEPHYYSLDPCLVARELSNQTRAVIVTNLFGHPAELALLRKLAHAKGAALIEDNSQSPFAMEGKSYAGTVGDIGVFSLNVHKHIQCGEGGIVVTNNDDYACAIRAFINHGEMAGDALGLNLRMTEVTAAIACAQVERADEIIQSRIDLAEQLIVGLKHNPLVQIREPRSGCRSVYYVLPMQIRQGLSRDWVLSELGTWGVPLVGGYVAPLYKLPAFFRHIPKNLCSVAERMHRKTLAYFEVCAYDPNQQQIQEIIDAFARVWDHACQKAASLETSQAPEGRP